MGQFGPLFTGRPSRGRFVVVGTYAVGALASSLLFGLVVHTAVGVPVRSALGDRGSLLLAAALAGGLLAVDGLRVWGGRITSLGLKRQTPHEWRLRGLAGVLGWGLDTGLPLSTVRATPLPVLGVILVAAGHAGPFHGLLYGIGLAAGLLAGVPASRASTGIAATMDGLVRRRGALGASRLVLAPSALTAAVLVSTWALHP